MLRRTAVRACLFIAATASGLGAQVKLAGSTESGFGPVFNFWNFSGDGMSQPTIDGATSVRITRVTQWSLPITVAVPVGQRWSVDLTRAYATSDISLSEQDPVTGTSSYSLSGLSDLRIRATGHLVGDNVLVTAGINLPTGKTELDEEELSALRVVGAPALSLQVPVLGVGAGGTLGLVLARQFGQWATALGTSYEMRRQ